MKYIKLSNIETAETTASENKESSKVSLESIK